MPRKARYILPGAIYHILSRGNNRQNVFRESTDHEKFLEILKEHTDKSGIKVYHYVVMGNHYHIIMKLGLEDNLGQLMKKLNLTYSKHYRKKYGGTGYLWQGRYKSFIIQGGKYLLECGRYIELNPVKAGIVNDPGEYKWSSYKAYANGEKDDLVEYSPAYYELGEKDEERKENYRMLVNEVKKEKRGLERYFRAKVCGDEKFIKKLKKEKGLEQLWSHRGRPKKKGKEC